MFLAYFAYSLTLLSAYFILERLSGGLAEQSVGRAFAFKESQLLSKPAHQIVSFRRRLALPL